MGVEDKGKEVDVVKESVEADVVEAEDVSPAVVGVGDDTRIVGELDAEPVLSVEDIDEDEDEGIVVEVSVRTVAAEEIELVSPQIEMMLLLSVLMYPLNFVSISSK